MDAEVPWLRLITSAADGRAGGAALWIAVFGVVAGWTLVETAVGSIHALVHRVERNLGDLATCPAGDRDPPPANSRRGRRR